MSDDEPEPARVETHHVAIDLLSCGDCERPLAAYRSAPRIEGARSKLYLICPECGHGAWIMVRDGRLAWSPVSWEAPPT